jgi:hypothetical protein
MFLWALPIALTLHVIEEFAFPGGFVRWIEVHNYRRLKTTRYYQGDAADRTREALPGRA